jgi:hypothetical protein
VRRGASAAADLGATDKIDFRSLDMVSSNADVKDHFRAIRGGVLIDLADDFGLTISLNGVNVADLTSSDFLV